MQWVAVGVLAVALLGCTWFLWFEVREQLPGKPFSHTWNPSWEALETKAECEVRMESIIATWVKAGAEAKGNHVVRVKPTKKHYSLLTYYCLPDTIDPRK
jgi:hypothetical protein